MTIIDDNTVVVFTSDELKNTLENNNNYTYIYFEVEKNQHSILQLIMKPALLWAVFSGRIVCSSWNRRQNILMSWNA